ncbi:LacI family DNA-binding transcriptional regulator [Cerasicoccus maritimus]|uniref:LacI family DNA-binding transcriptional regulator n=1 Tax=Cerasicoccus maritimus TaxID=490089 RepID=UPI0028526054|nr:LacI family DNA-binding transcriptional regulator [Cerasicoccus maritimus]
MAAKNARVTIRDIADAAGVHFTTVSLALRNSPKLKQVTRERIRGIAANLGYAPDPMVSALVSYRSRSMPKHYQATLAWVHDWSCREELYKIAEFREYYEGALECAAECGYKVEEFWLGRKDLTPARLARIFKTRNIQGVLIPPLEIQGDALKLPYEQLSCVSFGYSMRPALIDTVTNHQHHTMSLIFQQLLALGYRRIGLAIPNGWDGKVECAWEDSLVLFYHRRPELAQIPMFREDFEDIALPRLRQWLDDYQVDVILSHQYLLEYLKKLKLSVPRDIGFASAFLERDEQYLSGVYQNNHLLGRKAVELVIEKIHRRETGLPHSPTRTLIEGVWRPGKTLRPQDLATLP